MKKLLLLLGLVLLSGGVWSQKDFYSIDNIPEIKIYFQQSNWDAILDSLKQAGNDDRLIADLEVDGTRYEGVGIRYKGNSSYFNVRKTGSSKLPFNIKLDYRGKEHALPGGITKIKLANVFRDPSFLREAMSYEIAGKYMPAPRANFAKVYANDQYMGVYNNTEDVADDFLDKYYGDSDGTLFKCDPNWRVKTPDQCPEGDKASLMYLGEDTLCYMAFYELDSDSGWNDLIYLTRILNQGVDQIDTLLNVDQVLWMLAFNSVLVNLDSYTGMLCHNYYLYRDLKGGYHPIVWDMNLSFGAFRFAGLDRLPLRTSQMQELSPFIHYKQRNKKRPLITNLLGNDLFRKIYIAHIKTILKENFSEGQYLERAKMMHELIDPLVQADSNKLYTYEAFTQNISTAAKAGKQSIVGIEELMNKRTEYLQGHSLVGKDGPLIQKVEHLDFEEDLVVNATVTGAQKVWLYYRTDTSGLFQRMQMFDDSGHNDELEADDIWGATLDLPELAQYYIVAEGTAVASLSPKRASLEFHEFKKPSVN